MQWSPRQTFKEDVRLSNADNTVDVSLAKLNAAGTALTVNEQAIAQTTNGSQTFSGNVAITGTLAVTSGMVEPGGAFEIVASGDKTVTAAMSGRTFLFTAASGTQTANLPDAGTTAGYRYRFIAGHASGEVLVTPAAGDKIRCKATFDQGASVAPAAGTGVKNTAATNVIGDLLELVFDGVDTWHMVTQSGIWASQ